MTYLSFLIYFVITPAIIFAWVFRHHLTKRRWQELGVMSLVAVIWTTPWDNYLVATNVWWYDEARVLGIVLGYVPLEEYAFFVLQTVMTGLLFTGLMAHYPPQRPFTPLPPHWGLVPVVGIALVVLLALLQQDRQWNYFILQVGWLALPPLAIQYLWGLDLLLHYWRVWLPGVTIPTIWLASMDAIAIHIGVWTIDPAQTIPLKIGGILPFEEALFFLITNLLIVQGLILIIVPESWARLRQLQARWLSMSEG
jgi:lycopene cyclase domain-containing protein